MAKSRKKEKLKQVWTSIHPDDYLKLEILEARTGFPIFHHVRKAIEEYVRDVTARPPTDSEGNVIDFQLHFSDTRIK